MSKTVLITGASGKIGFKLRRHFDTLGWTQRLICYPEQEPGAITADLSSYSERWAEQFSGVDAVIHLAANPSQFATWESAEKNNIRTLSNALDAARTYGAKRFIFASSNWVMAGYRYTQDMLTSHLAPKPINPYGYSKLVGEQFGVSAAQDGRLSFIALRIGYCPPDNLAPGPHLDMGRWGQNMWLSDRDLCHGMERAVMAENIPCAILNLTSNNPGMRWDINETRKIIGYQPQDGASTVLTPKIWIQEVKDRFYNKLATLNRSPT